jgi:thiamine-phosphate pyrophosphorylase
MWLMTDPRIDDRLLRAIRKLPRGSGVVFRHYALAPDVRRQLFGQVRRVCAQRGHCLLLAGDELTAMRWNADGVHALTGGRLRSKRLLRTAPVHNIGEIRKGAKRGALALFLSPVRQTRSHPGQRPLGASRFAQLAKLSPVKVIALGGMSRAHAKKLTTRLAHGWAAIDAFA